MARKVSSSKKTTALRKKFKLRPKPKKPRRQTTSRRFDIGLYESVQSLLERLRCLEKEGVDLSDCVLEDEITYGGIVNILFTYPHKETDEELAARMEIYKKRLTRYEAWCAANEKKIKEEIALRIQEEKESARKEQVETEKHLTKEINRLEQLRAKLGDARKAK